MSIFKKVTFLVPVLYESEELEAAIKSILNQNWLRIEIICLIDKTCFDSSFKKRSGFLPGVLTHVVDISSQGISRILNEGILLSNGEVIFLMLPFVRLLPGFLPNYINELFSDQSIGFVCGNFFEEITTEKGIIRGTLCDEFDYSEATQIGPVRGFKKEVLEIIGTYDETLRFSYEYDLRLRITERFKIAHVEKPLYKLVYPKLHSALDDKTKSLYCFIPMNQDSHRYSYLLYNQEKETEFSETCFRSLKRRNAFLTHPFSPLICPHRNLKGPLISVVIPLFNRSQFVGKAIESVLKSTYKNFEIIIVDNGSSDGSVEVVKRYLGENNVRLCLNDRNNIARALNLGSRMAKGKYISELSSDDLYTPRTLEILFSYMESNPNCALGVSYYDRIGVDDEVLPNFGVIKHLEYNRNNLIRTDGIGAARIWHRCVLEELGGFDEDNLGNYGEDYDLQLKVSEKYEILRIPHVLYHYRKHSGNTEKIFDFKTRYVKKTFARKAAILRRQAINSLLNHNSK